MHKLFNGEVVRARRCLADVDRRSRMVLTRKFGTSHIALQFECFVMDGAERLVLIRRHNEGISTIAVGAAPVRPAERRVYPRRLPGGFNKSCIWSVAIRLRRDQGNRGTVIVGSIQEAMTGEDDGEYVSEYS
jgi:hypothetical protein